MTKQEEEKLIKVVIDFQKKINEIIKWINILKDISFKRINIKKD